MIDGNWKSSTLAELVDDAIGGLWGSPPDTTKGEETDVLVVRGADFRVWDARRALDAAPRRVPTRSLQRRRLAPGDLVLEVSGGSPAQPVGRVLIIDDTAVAKSPRPLICSNFCRKLRLKPGVDPHFVKRQLDWLYRSGHTNNFQTSTTNIRNLQVDDFLRGTSVVLPDPYVQVQLTAVLDRVDASRDSGARHLAAAHRATERFRQAVLDSACSGRLTADWREAHPSIGTGADVVDAVRRAKAGLPKVIPPEEIAPPNGEEIPDSWAWVMFGSVIGELRNGVSPAPAMEPPGIRILRISAVRSNSVDLGDLRFLRDDLNKWRAFTLKDGDLLFTRYNGSIALLGVCGMVRGLGQQTLLYPDKLMRVRLHHDEILPEYIEIFFSSSGARERMTEGSVSSAGQQGVSGTTVKSQPLAVPPIAEQEEIVRRASGLLAAADGVLAKIDAVSHRVDSTSQAVLGKAFRGELLLTGPDLSPISKDS